MRAKAIAQGYRQNKYHVVVIIYKLANINMRYIIPVFILLISLIGCDSKRDENKRQIENDVPKELVKPKPMWSNLNLDIEIELNDSIFSTCDSIKMKVKLTNNQDENQRFLFDEPRTMNPTILEINDINGLSVVQNHWSHLSSKAWLSEELIEFYYDLKPDQSITREFYLTRIAVIRNPDIAGPNNSKLKDGNYTLRMKFGKNYSDIQKFTINRKLE